MTDTITRPKRAPHGSAYATFLALQAHATDECVVWPHGQDRHGYGVVRCEGKDAGVHRLSCEMAHGPAPFPKAEAAHSCNNPPCLNPRHLRWATREENEADKINAGTSNRGERHGMVKLTEADVRLIRCHAGAKQVVMARWFGVDPSAVRNVLIGKTWGWLR